MKAIKTIKKKIEIFHVDAFTKNVFSGNPAIVCILDKKIDDELMQKIAFEVNLSETAFLVANESKVGNVNEYGIRWFTPKEEVSLCGHATLAASEVLFNHKRLSTDEITYHSKSGILKARRDVSGISLDFPLDNVIETCGCKYKKLFKAMGISTYEKVLIGANTKKLIVHLKHKERVLNVNPNYQKMKDSRVEGIKGVGITSIDNRKYDFITRYFNPWVGVNEDPVTGSVHTLLASYWSNILGKTELRAYQASNRGGEMTLRVKDNNRVEIIGEARIIYSGELSIDFDNYK